MRFKAPFADSEANSRLVPLSVYKLYLAMKTHFQGRFDVLQYNWQIKVSENAFNKRKDIYFFVKLAQRFTFKEIYFIFLSNFVANPDFWVGDVDEDSIVFYRQYIGKLQRLDNVFVDDVKNVYEFAKMKEIPVSLVFKYSEKSSTSYISKLVLSNVISYESFLIFDSFLGIINKHDQVADDIIWSDFSIKLKAYRKIFDLTEKDIIKYRNLMKQTLIKLN